MVGNLCAKVIVEILILVLSSLIDCVICIINHDINLLCEMVLSWVVRWDNLYVARCFETLWLFVVGWEVVFYYWCMLVIIMFALLPLAYPCMSKVVVFN